MGMEYAWTVELNKKGGAKQALTVLEKLAKSDFILGDYVALDLARIAKKKGDHAQVVRYLSAIGKDYSHSPILQTANRLTIESACVDIGSSECGKALKVMKAGDTPKDFEPEKLFLEAKRHGLARRKYEAYRLYQKIFYNHPDSDKSEEARVETVRLRADAPAKLKGAYPEATYKQKIMRTKKLMSRFRYLDAAKYLKSMQNGKLSDKEKIETRYMLALALRKSREYDKAKKEFQKVIMLDPAGGKSAQSEYQIAVIDWNLNRDEECSVRLKKLIAGDIDFRLKQRALVVLGKIEDSRGNFQVARRYYNDAYSFFAGRHFKENLSWMLGWMEYRSKNYEQAAKLFTPGLFSTDQWKSKALYWRIRSLKSKGDDKKAMKDRESLLTKFSHTYYGARLAPTDKITKISEKKMMPDKPHGANLNSGVKLSRKARLYYDRIKLLMFSGLSGKAAPEIDKLKKLVGKGEGELLWLSSLYLSAGAPAKAIKLQWKIIQSIRDKNNYDHPAWRVYYPAAHWRHIKAESKKQGLDPLLALSVIRQESSFDQDAHSPANARGLMQLIPSTGKRVFDQLGLARRIGRSFDESLLYDPEINITLGVAHLADLMKKYNGSVHLTAAAYNAGETAVDLWTTRYRLEPEDEFIEMIPYGETKEYVKKVLRNRVMYSKIYSEQALQPPKPAGSAAQEHVSVYNGRDGAN